jgi:hypothetical protein
MPMLRLIIGVAPGWAAIVTALLIPVQVPYCPEARHMRCPATAACNWLAKLAGVALKLHAAEDLTLDDALVRELEDKLLDVLLCNELMLDDDLATEDDKLIRLDDEFDEEILFDELLEDELLFDELLDEEILLKTLLTEELERITIIEDDDSELLLEELLLDLLLEMIVSLLELIVSLSELIVSILELVSALLLARLAAIDEDNTLLEMLDSSFP